jgi:hypothetical protein
MKRGIMTLTMVSCLASALAFADNPSDAPLAPNDGSTPVVQSEKRVHSVHRQASEKSASSQKEKCVTVSQNTPKPEAGKAAGSTTAN